MVRTLSCRFRELRRPDTPRKPKGKDKTTSKPKQKLPGIVNTVKVPTPLPGEDAVSYERHIRALQMEYKKSRRNSQVISKFMYIAKSIIVCVCTLIFADDLMERTFPSRYAEIRGKPCGIKALFERYPFLQEPDQVYMVHDSSFNAHPRKCANHPMDSAFIIMTI